MAAPTLPESPIRARRRKRRMLLVWGIWGACVAAALFVVWLAQASFLRIQTIEVLGARTVAEEAIRTNTMAMLEGSYLFMFPKNNIFLYPKAEIENALLVAFPTLSGVDVGAENFTTISINASDREPRALWCGQNFELLEACVLVDEEGHAYALAPEFSGTPYVRYYGALGGERLPRPFLTADSFRTLAALIDALSHQASSERVSGVRVDEVGDVEMRFESSFKLFFGLEEDSGDTFERFTLALQSEPLRGQPLSRLEYLDLRFGDRLYYVWKVEE